MSHVQANSTKFALQVAAEAAEPLPEPPQRLDEHAMRFWEATINSKRRSAWTESDMLSACQLCRDLAAVETLSADLEENGAVLEDSKGKRYTNPAARLLDAAARRVLAAQKHLQIHSLATNGEVSQQKNKNAAARQVTANLAEVSPLIARPKLAG